MFIWYNFIYDLNILFINILINKSKKSVFKLIGVNLWNVNVRQGMRAEELNFQVIEKVSLIVKILNCPHYS